MSRPTWDGSRRLTEIGSDAYTPVDAIREFSARPTFIMLFLLHSPAPWPTIHNLRSPSLGLQA